MHWLPAAAALLMVGLNLLPRLAWVDVTGDDGMVAAQAMLVAAGKLPYRDFFALETPGAPLLYGALFKAFGSSYLVLRLLTALAVLAGVLLLYLIARPLLPPVWSALVAGLWGTWTANVLLFSPYHYWGITLVLLMTWTVVRGSRSAGRSKWFFMAGLAGGTAVLFEQSLAIACVLAIIAALVLGLQLRQGVLPMVLGGAVALTSLLAYLLISGSLQAFVGQTATYTLGSYARVNRSDMPWLPGSLLSSTPWEASVFQYWTLFVDWLIEVPSQLSVALFALWGVVWGRRRLQQELLAVAIISPGLMADSLSTFIQAPSLWRSTALTLVVLAVLVHRRYASAGTRSSSVIVAAVKIAAVAGLGVVLTGPLLDCRTNSHSLLRMVSMPSETVCVTSDQTDDFQTIKALSDAHPGESIAFLPLLGPMYPLTGETPPVSYHFLTKGLATKIQLDSLETELNDRHVRWVVYYRYPWKEVAPYFPNNPEIGSDQPWQLEEYLDSHYTVYERLGRLVIYFREA